MFTLKRFLALTVWVLSFTFGIAVGIIIADRYPSRHLPTQTGRGDIVNNTHQKTIEDFHNTTIESAAASDCEDSVVLTQNNKPSPPKAITIKHHIKEGTLAYANNNPFNLKFAGQDGATMGYKGFAKFPTVEDGVAAGYRQIALDADRGHTIGSFLTKYAPPSDGNDTSAYVDFICVGMGVTPHQKMNELDFDLHKLGLLMMRMESNTRQEYIYSDNYSN